MAKYTVVLTDLEDKVLQALATQRSAESGTTITAEQLIQLNASNILKPYIDDYGKRREAILIGGFRAASEDEKAVIEAAVPKGK